MHECAIVQNFAVTVIVLSEGQFINLQLHGMINQKDL